MAKGKSGVRTFDDILEYLKNGGEKSLTVADGAALFERHDSAFEALEEMAIFNSASGEFTGGARLDKLSGVKRALKQNEMFSDLAENLGENAGALSKTLEANKKKLTKGFGGLVRDLDHVTSQIVKAESRIGEDLTRKTGQLQKAFDREMKGLNKALLDAGTDVDAIKAVEKNIEKLGARHEKALEALTSAAESRTTLLGEMSTEIKTVLQDIEKTTGLNAADFRKGTSQVAKLTAGAESSLAKTAEKELTGFARVWSTGMGKAGVIAAGLAGAYVLSKALGGGSQDQGRTA